MLCATNAKKLRVVLATAGALARCAVHLPSDFRRLRMAPAVHQLASGRVKPEATMRTNDSHAMQAYRGQLAGVAPLDRATEQELTRQWRAGNRRAGEKLVTACLPFVFSIALEYRRWGIPLEDIIQQGNLGLLRAASKFDLGKECRLATYAAYWIRAEIRDYVVRGYRVVRLGTTKAERRALRAYRKTRETDPATLAAVSGMTTEKAAWLLPLLVAREASLEARPDDHGALSERLPAVRPSPEDDATASERRVRAKAAVGEALQELTDRERMIVHARLMSDDPRTLQDIGAELGVSKERVRQLEERACSKLRARLEQLRELAA
jgi:RNA polymerase sigma-32 factor